MLWAYVDLVDRFQVAHAGPLFDGKVTRLHLQDRIEKGTSGSDSSAWAGSACASRPEPAQGGQSWKGNSTS